jgi:Flp pilus assembly protein TadG
MKTCFRRHVPKFERGSAAVEAALIIPFILVPLLLFVFLFGRYFWYYTVAQKAVHDAMLVMAQSQLSDVKSQGAKNLGVDIINRELSDIDSETLATLSTTINCGYAVPANSSNIQFINCNATATPKFVQASVVMVVNDPLLGRFFQSEGLPIWVTASSRYVGYMIR